MAKTETPGKSVRSARPALAVGRASASEPALASTPHLAPAHPVCPSPPDAPPLDDTNMSVAGEEDPGAALDITGTSVPSAPPVRESPG